MNNKSDHSAGRGLDVSPVNTSSNESLTRSSDFLKIVSHNVQGLSTTCKQQQLLTFLDLHNIDIMGLSETKLAGSSTQYVLSHHLNDNYRS